MGLTPTLPNPTSPMMGGGVPPIPAPTPPNVVPASQAQPPAPDPQAAEAAHSALIGKAFKALSGQTTQYAIDPATGKMQQTQVQNTPGQFFKNVVAAALLGGAMGEDKARQNEGSGLAAFTQGGSAVVNRDEQQNQQRIQQAQQDYQNQLRAQQEQREQATSQREAQEAPLRQDMLKAQTASYNAQVVRDAIDTQSKDFSYHNEVAEAGKTKATSIFDNNGVPPFKTGLSESDAAQFIKDTPGASAKYIAIPTGTKTTLDKNGQPVWENTFSLYDNSVTTPVTDAWLKTPEMQALKTQEPDYFAVLQKKAAANETLTPEQRTSVLTAAKTAYGAQTTQNSTDLAAQREQALIQEAKDHSKEYNAEIGKMWADRKDQEFAQNSLQAVLAGNNGTYKKGDKIPAGAKVGDAIPITNKQYASALSVFQANAKNAHDNWIASIDAAKGEDDPNGPLHRDVVDRGVEAANAQAVVSGIVQRAGGGAPAPTGTPMLNPDGLTVLVTPDKMALALKNGYKAVGAQPTSDPNEQVVVKIGNSTQTMSRADFAAKKQEWSGTDPATNPTAAAWANATVTGVAPPPTGARTFPSADTLH